MLPYSSHLLQPLHVSCFAFLKRAYGRQIEEYVRAGINHIDKLDFLIAFVSARKESIAIDTVSSGFTATGLVPYDPKQVLPKLNTQLRTPTRLLQFFLYKTLGYLKTLQYLSIRASSSGDQSIYQSSYDKSTKSDKPNFKPAF